MVEKIVVMRIKKKLLFIFAVTQIVCNILYTLLTKVHHVIFYLQNFWVSFIMYAEYAVGLLEIAIIIISIFYVGTIIRTFWKMVGTVAVYLSVIYLIEFVLQWGIGLYGFSPISYLRNSLAYMVIFCIFACVFFLFQKYILKNY